MALQESPHPMQDGMRAMSEDDMQARALAQQDGMRNAWRLGHFKVIGGVGAQNSTNPQCCNALDSMLIAQFPPAPRLTLRQKLLKWLR